jgi:hypothetical protein
LKEKISRFQSAHFKRALKEYFMGEKNKGVKETKKPALKSLKEKRKEKREKENNKNI